MIQILTGPVRSHKTTQLHQWVNNRHDCGGVLSPDYNEMRQLYQISGRKSIPWQKELSDQSTDLLIGRFVFDAAAFEKALEWLDRDFVNPNVHYIIIDEIGPLELTGKGWDPWLRKALHSKHEKNFILVVREGLVDEVVSHYGIKAYEVITKAYFERDDEG